MRPNAAAAGDGMQMPPRGATASHGFDVPDYERLRALAALYEKPPRAKRRPMYRTVLMLLTFAFGASAGLAATWWFSGTRNMPAPASLSRSLPTVPATREGQSMPSVRGGISASELPYDGRKQALAATVPVPVPKTNPAELPYDGQPSVSGEDHADTANAKRSNKVLRADAGNGGLSERTTEKREAQLQDSRRKSAKAHRPAPRVMKDREIDRIRQQADEELKKKSDRRRAVNDMRARARSSPSQTLGREGARRESRTPSHMQSRLARCARSRNFIRREQCKWRLCGGMWGKNGCPSYAHATPY